MIYACMTASLRAETLAITLDSFKKYVRVEGEIEWLVNIDPAGDGEPADVIREFESRRLMATFNIAERPNLNAALRWCYRAADAPFFYMTEDDVEYRGPFDLQAAIEEFPKHDRLAYLAVPRCPFPKDDRAGIQNGPTEGPITWREGHYKMCLGPGLLSSEFARGCADWMHDTLDPEFQFHRLGEPVAKFVNSGGWRFATFSEDHEQYPTCGPFNGCRHPIWDIGRAYRDRRGLKWVQTPQGIVWQKTGNE